MTTRIGPVVKLTALLLALAFLVGCGNKPAGRSTLTTTVGNRDVKASLDGSGSISSTGDTVQISFAAGKVVIEKDTVRLDGEEVAKLPEDAKKVEVDYTAGKLTVTADGQSVFSKEVRK